MTTAVYKRPWLYPKQQAALFTSARYGLVEASTKSGKTVGALVWLTEQAMSGKPHRNYWWIAPVYAQAKVAFRRLKAALPRQVYAANETELTVTLGNGAVVWFKSGEHPDSLYGEDVWAAVIDEATRVREEAWHAIRSTLTATEGPIRIIGNVKGRKNWAYRLARRADGGEPNMAYARITAHDAVEAGILSAEEVQDAKRQLPPAVFSELYEAIPSDDQGNPFGLVAIQAAIAPLSGAPVTCWGWDLAKSVDWTVGVGLDSRGYTGALQRFQTPWQETIGRIREATGSTPALVDSTGVGDPIVEQLQRGGGNYKGYPFTSASKQKLMEGLAAAIQQGQVHFPAGPVSLELEAYEYVYTREGVRYAAMAGMHDDCVCALALAVHQQTRPVAKVWL